MATDQWKDKENTLDYYYPPLERTKILRCAKMCMSFEDNLLNEISQSQKKKTNAMWSPFIWGAQSSQIQRQKAEQRCQQLWGGENVKLLFKGSRVSFHKVKRIMGMDVAMIAQKCECV